MGNAVSVKLLWHTERKEINENSYHSRLSYSTYDVTRKMGSATIVLTHFHSACLYSGLSMLIGFFGSLLWLAGDGLGGGVGTYGLGVGIVDLIGGWAFDGLGGVVGAAGVVAGREAVASTASGCLSLATALGLVVVALVVCFAAAAAAAEALASLFFAGALSAAEATPALSFFDVDFLAFLTAVLLDAWAPLDEVAEYWRMLRQL